jgi:hypothetical protein
MGRARDIANIINSGTFITPDSASATYLPLSGGSVTGGIFYANRPFFNAHRTSNQNIASSAITNLIWNSVDPHIGGGFNTTTGRYTIPVSGLYYFRWEAMIMGLSTVGFLNVSLEIDGSLQEEIMISGFRSDYNTLGNDYIVRLNAGQIVGVLLYSSGLGGSPYVRGSSSMNRFQGYLIG